jgi:hypothetical protein
MAFLLQYNSVKLFSSFSWSLDSLTPPWRSEVSLFIFLRDNPGSRALPETARPRNPNELGWAPGALDGLLGRTIALPKEEDNGSRVQKLLDALNRLLKKASDSNLNSLYCIVIEGDILPVADQLLARLSSHFTTSQKSRLAQVGRYFASGADHAEAAKFGILLLEIGATRFDIPLLEVLATNDEFTLYSALALTRLVDNPEQCLWSIAKRVHGWGRIQIVERLAKTQNPEIQAWMLREGFRNEIMDEYLVGVCARAGHLDRALKNSHPDRQLLNGAAGILRALISGGPADSIDDYEQAPEATLAYADHISREPALDLVHLLCVSDIVKFLSDQTLWDSRRAKGWTDELREQIQRQCSEVFSRDKWRQIIARQLESEDTEKFYEADVAATQLGISTRDLHFAKVRAAPLSSHSWYRLLEQTDENQIDEVLAFASNALPLEKIGTGPEDQLGLGREYEPHQALVLLLQALSRFPGRGWELIRTGLRSPVVNNRHMAIRALLAWNREQWPAEALGFLQNAVRIEPNEKVRVQMEKAIRSN